MTTVKDAPSEALPAAALTSVAALGEGLALVPGVRVERLVDGMVRLYRGRRGIALGRLAPAIDPLVDLLAAGACTEELLTEQVLRVGPELRLLDLHLLLQRLRSGGWLDRILTFDGAPVLTVRPISPHLPEPIRRDAAEQTRVKMSRFTVLRADGDNLLVESPLAHVELVLHDPRVLAVIHDITTRAASSGHLLVPPGLRDAVMATLLEYSFATDGDGEDDFTHVMWAPHELWFHARSRASSRRAHAALSFDTGFAGSVSARSTDSASIA